MNSFNVYGQTEKKVGGNTPVWLGTVKPIPVGATLDGYVLGEVAKAGTAVNYDPVTKIASCKGVDRLTLANAFLYNDVLVENHEDKATCAVVMHHPEGLMIERVYPEITEEQIAELQAKVPGVLLVRG